MKAITLLNETMAIEITEETFFFFFSVDLKDKFDTRRYSLPVLCPVFVRSFSNCHFRNNVDYNSVES